MGVKLVSRARHGNPGRRNRPCRRHGVGIGGRSPSEEVGHGEARSLAEKYDRNEWRLEAELVDRTDIFTDVIDAISSAKGGVVTAENIPGKTDAWPQAGGDAVAERGSVGISREAGYAQLVDATGINEGVGAGVGKV